MNKYIKHIILFVIFIINYFGVSGICKGETNSNPIWDQQLVYQSSVPNGELYLSGNIENNSSVPVLHVYGSPYEMGYAHGQLLSEGIKFVMDNYLEYFGAEILSELGNLPAWVAEIIEKEGLSFALDLQGEAVKSHTPPRYWEEMQGMADALGVSLEDVVRFHMLPELVRASCSMMGAWGKAVPIGKTLVQLRALDWDTTSPLTLKPLVIVYHPDEGHTFMTLSFQGFIGAITGYSGHTGICEKVWASYNGTNNRFGEPFFFVLRDILQFDTTVDQAINRIYAADRTCSVYMGIGSNSSNTFTAVEYSYETVRIFDDVTPFEIYSPVYTPHELFQNLVYIDPDEESAATQCMSGQISRYYGNITADNIVQIIAYLQTGNLHAAIYDYNEDSFTFSVASHNLSWPLTQSPSLAYQNQFIKLNVASLFNLQPSVNRNNQKEGFVINFQ